ncbi:ATP-dependent Clp protease proteolytic subunit [Pseudonocardia sp. CA-107938]|uniref:ATP-dependent Clp protease proteolytic subunit n=1 Tax=Pseudonocardia sp. CA-107938 TaxID=3240021 RepID=UPI003D8B2C45
MHLSEHTPPPALLHVGDRRWWSDPDAADAAVSDQLLAERIVVVAGELDDTAAHRLVSRLLLLDAIDARRDITLHLTGAGGTTAAALAVRDVLGHVRADVATWAVGIVSGAVQVLLTAGTPGKRYAQPQARIQLRRPALGGSAGIHDELRAQLTALAAGDAGRPVADLSADLDEGRWFTAAQAQAHGLVDHVGREVG